MSVRIPELIDPESDCAWADAFELAQHMLLVSAWQCAPVPDKHTVTNC